MTDPRQAPSRACLIWLAVGVIGFLFVPWYSLQDSVFALAWVPRFTTKESAPALLQSLLYGRGWLVPIGLVLAAGVWPAFVTKDRRARAQALAAIGATGFVYCLLQGFAIGPTGWSFESLAAGLPALPGGQLGLGLGAVLVLTCFTMLFSIGLAGLGYFKGDPFVAASVVAVTTLVAVFTFFPVLRILISALQDAGGAFSLSAWDTTSIPTCLTGLLRKVAAASSTLLPALASRRRSDRSPPEFATLPWSISESRTRRSVSPT